MKIILAGHEGSKQILSASSYLLNKYIEGFEIQFLNYGQFNEKLFCGEYISLDEEQFGGSKAWALYTREYLKTLDDEFIIFGLDDYLLSKELNNNIYASLLRLIIGNDYIVCARLCNSDFYKPNEYLTISNDLFILKDAQYSVTTQYCIWRRETLIDILDQVDTPWAFEIDGSQILNRTDKKVIGSFKTALEYPDASALSTKWENKIRVAGNNEADINHLIGAGLLNKEKIRYE
jgi:hypothetical protein